MDARLKTGFKWLLPIPALVLGVFVAIIGLECSILLDRPALATLEHLGIVLPPSSILQPLHLLAMLVIAHVLVWPAALTVGFALRASWKTSLHRGSSVAVLLGAAYLWFALPLAFARWAVVAAAAVVLCALTTQLRFIRYRLQTKANVVAALLLFMPSLMAVAHTSRYPPEATRVWTTVLQAQTWQGMNTGSEYAATRQVVVAGDRVLAIFDAGSAGYQGDWPLSRYRLVSLDRNSGTQKNEIDLTGRWGSMPYLYPMKGNTFEVQSDPLRLLNPDLTIADKVVPPGVPAESGATPQDEKLLGNCEFHPFVLKNDAGWRFGCKTIRMVDMQGKLLAEQPVIDGFARLAGTSGDGSRFALESSQSEGDPEFLLFEHFTIYDGSTGVPISMITIKNLPERQSWSAFSPDGKSFVVGNPNNLSLYRIP